MNPILSRFSVIASKIGLQKTVALTIKRLKPVLVLAVGSLAALSFSGAHRFASVDSARAASCAGPEYRSFDFWMGDWKAFDADNPAKAVAHTRVDRILDGCVLLEDYEGTDGSHGESFTIYDASRQVWHQSWVTNHGVVLVIEGKLQSGEMVLSGVSHPSDGKEKFVRGVWKPVTGGVRETAVTSTDGGKTWNPWFDLMFRPATSGTSTNTSPNDRSIIAGLDTQYQAAVKNNDANTMAQILADDFVLVTGSGKTYSKTDLLNEARSGRIVYEHQEDGEQTVRVWGDSAVVTAKLWEKGTENGKPFEYTVWFSDLYLCTPSGWQYEFGQSSLPLPKILE
jgi:ketosteroid isomerase-like protein